MANTTAQSIDTALKRPVARGKAIKLLVLLTAAWGTGGAVASAQSSRNVADTTTFVECLNGIRRANGTTADAVRCVPRGCYFTVTMSTVSGQPACTRGGCSLPRVIFSCPGSDETLRFRPSFTLCPTNINRIELGEDITPGGIMLMGDIDLPPGTSFPDITEDDVLSKVVSGSIRGTKGCNPCHGDGGTLDDNQLSQPIDPFGKFLGVIDLAPFVIDTNEPGKTVDPSVRESLAEICSCVESSRELAKDQTLDRQLILHLCERLSAKTSPE